MISVCNKEFCISDILSESSSFIKMHTCLEIMSRILQISFVVMYAVSTSDAEILRLPCKHFANFSIIKPNAALQGSVIATLLFKSERECRFDCMTNSQCKSINRQEGGDQICELNNRTSEDLRDDVSLDPRPGWTFQSTDYADPLLGENCRNKKPCDNSVLCRDTCECPGYQCGRPCPEGQFGLRCEAIRDCNALMIGSGPVYPIVMPVPGDTMRVRCYNDTTAARVWMFIHRNNEEASKLISNRTWQEYKKGFGDLKTSFWLGLERIHKLTSTQRNVELKFSMKLNNNNLLNKKWKNGRYSSFKVSGESDGYRLEVGDYIPQIQDDKRAPDFFGCLNETKFSTFDVINSQDGINHAILNGAGWWYNTSNSSCREANFNTNSVDFSGLADVRVVLSDMAIRFTDGDTS